MKSSLEKGYFIALENMDELALLDQHIKFLPLPIHWTPDKSLTPVLIVSAYPSLYLEHLTNLLTPPVLIVSVYHALYLEHLTSQELLEKLAKLYNVSGEQIGELYCQGPSGIYVLLNDEVLQNMSEQSRFCVEAMKCKSRLSVDWRFY